MQHANILLPGLACSATSRDVACNTMYVLSVTLLQCCANPGTKMGMHLHHAWRKCKAKLFLPRNDCGVGDNGVAIIVLLPISTCTPGSSSAKQHVSRHIGYLSKTA
jgi:hypothetical protein